MRAAAEPSSAMRQRVRIFRMTARNAPNTITYTTMTRPSIVHSELARVSVTASETRMWL